MNRTWIGVIGAILAVMCSVWLLGGSKLHSRESARDKDKQVIDFKR